MRDSGSGSARPSGSIRSGGSGAEPRQRAADRQSRPAATSAYSSASSTGRLRWRCSPSQRLSMRLGAESASCTVVFDQLTDQVGVLPLPGDGERTRQDPGRDVGRPAHPGVGVGDRVPHRVDGQRGGHLQFGGLLEFRPGVVGVGQRLGPQDASPDGRRAARTAASCAGATSRVVRGPAVDRSVAAAKSLAEDVDPAALQQNSVDVQRLLSLAPVPFGVAETLVGVVERADGRC